MDKLTWWSTLSPTNKLLTGMWIVIGVQSTVIVWEEKDKREAIAQLKAEYDTTTNRQSRRIDYLVEALRVSEIACERDKTQAVKEALEESKTRILRQEELISLQRELFNSTNSNMNVLQRRLDRAQKAINKVK